MASACMPSVPRARLSTSVEPTGTSWNSVRWARPSGVGGYRTSRLASAFETVSPLTSSVRPTSAASSTSSRAGGSSRVCSPQSGYGTLPSKLLRAPERSSRFGSSLASSTSNETTARSSLSAGGGVSVAALSPRHEPQRKTFPYRTTGLSQTRAALVDLRYNLRPVNKRQTERNNNYKSTISTTKSSSPFVNSSQLRNSLIETTTTTLSPISKCVSPSSMSISRSPSTVASPPIVSPNSGILTTTTQPRPIPKSERPWRQKLADAQRFREARETERAFAAGHHHNPMAVEPSDATMRLMAARSARRVISNELHQQHQQHSNNERELEKEIAALKCFVSKPGALDKNATVAKFRQTMAESQALIEQPSNTKQQISPSLSTVSASALLLRMPSLSRRSTTSVTKESLNERKSKDRPQSLIETTNGPLAHRRLSIVKETNSGNEGKTKSELSTKTTISPSTNKNSDLINKKDVCIKKKSLSPQQQPEIKQNIQTSINSTKTTKTNGEEKENKQIRTTTNLIKRKNSKEEINKNQQQKNVLIPAATTTEKKDEKEVVVKGKTKIEQIAVGKNQKPLTTPTKIDESKFNAVVQFKPQSLIRRKISENSLTEPKPVPGSWERTPREQFISQNKHLIRKAASESISHTRRIRPLARISSLRFYSISAPPTTGKRITINNKNNSDLNKIIKTNETNIIRLTGSPTTTTMKSTAKPKQQQNICSFASLDKQFANKRSFRLGVRKTIILKNTPQKVYAQLCCRSAQLIATTIKFNIVWKEQQKRANVTILSSDIRKVSQKHFRQPLLKIKTKAINQLKQITENLNENNIPVILKTSISENIKKQSEAPILKTLIKQVPPSVNNRQPIVVESVGNLGKAVGISSVSISNSTVKTQQQQNQQPIVPPVPPHRSQKQEQNQQQKEQPRKTSTTTILPLILPDKSVLEQFVQNKRDILDQLHEEAEEILSQTRDLSTCGTTTNKLLNLPLKETTTISSLPESKRNSQMLIASIMPPQEAQSLNSSYHSAIQDDLFGTNNNIPINIQQQQFNRQRKPIDLFGKTTLLTTHQFEKPKSLFEEKMQKQAFQLQEKAVRQSLNEPIEINNLNQSNLNLRRKSATNENADLAQTFVNQTQKPYQQEQRYAAYISLSGRQSTASCESGNSGDTENRQMGQMIDQARYKHNQQRNKFKEAIDYLDHIFEDFQRETDLNQQQKEEIKQTKQQQQMPQQSRLEVVVRPGNVKSAKEAFEKVAAALANERTASKIKKHQTSQQQQKQQIPSLPLSQQQPTIVLKRQQSYPLMVVQRSTQQQQFNSDRNAKIPAVIPPQSIVAENGSNKNNNNNLEEEEVSVAETIVLPSKNTSDRLDFTRNWLTNDGQSGWTESSGGGENSVPKPYSVKGGIIIQDVKDWDEHSLGSCSAEVAAINAPNERRLKQKEKQQQLILIKNQQQQKQNKQQIRQKQPPSLQQQQANNNNNIPPPQISVAAVIPAAVRPQPFRPQIGILPGGQMHKTPSIEQIRFLRAASQDCPPTNMASSIHSHEGFFNFQPGAACCLSTHSLQRIGFGGGAFHSYTPTVAQMQQKQISKQQKQQQLNYINQQQYLKGSIQSLPDSALSTAPNNNLIYLPGEVTNIYSNNNNNNYQPTYSQHLNRTTNNSDCNQQRQQQNKFISNKEKQQQIQTDHSLAIDALVAELELDTNLNSSNEKRRSFPTIQTEVNNQKVSNNNRNITNRPAFETINQERINPSKVDAMAKMFDKQTIKTKTSNPLSFTTNGDSTTNWSSRRNANQTIQQQHKQIERGPSLKTTTKFQLKETPPTPPPHSSKHLKQTTLYKQRQSPQFVKGTKAGVCSDRRYVVGNTKQQNINNNNESEQQQRFNTSNGFYDNVDQQHQCSPPLPPSNYHHFRNDDLIDCASMSSREIELPPQPPNQNNNGINNVPKTAGKRIGQLIKKLGNSVGGDKQQNGISAVSTLSLNRSAHEQLPTVRNGLGVKEEILTKSNSLSSERWRSQAMAQQQNLDSQDLDEDKSHGVGLGNRLKQTILGGMVRRRVPT